MVRYPCLRYSKFGGNGYNTFKIAPFNFVFHKLHTMEPTWRSQLGDLESDRHRMKRIGIYFKPIGIIGINTIRTIGLFCLQMRLEMARLGLQIERMAPNSNQDIHSSVTRW